VLDRLLTLALLAAASLPAAGPAPQEPAALPPGPASDPDDPTLWPNRASRANSDRWILQHHDEIRRMRPRLLVLNFSNRLPPDQIEVQTRALIAAVAESSRYHGFEDESAPVFLQYEIFKIVDLRDPDRTDGNSAHSPIKPDAAEGINMDYGALFNARFAALYGVRDPEDPERCLSLKELVQRGFVHELWFFSCVDDRLRCLECVEQKPLYDEALRRVGDEFRQAGNGGDDDQPWIGRSLRINNINHERGIGCAMENLGHALEGMAHSGCIPYFQRYFHEFAGFDLDTRFGLPFDSFYPLWGESQGVEYPDPQTAVVKDGAREWRVDRYTAAGGNVHFPPNGRRHYDLDNEAPVLSTIEDWRIGSGPDGRDIAMPWTNGRFARYRELAPDCMGPWLVYWRQCIPGLGNRQRDDDGRPMKNWWVFLFY